jgi:hypothetical protein
MKSESHRSGSDVAVVYFQVLSLYIYIMKETEKCRQTSDKKEALLEITPGFANKTACDI